LIGINVKGDGNGILRNIILALFWSYWGKTEGIFVGVVDLQPRFGTRTCQIQRRDVMMYDMT
jgi:hypothetical protein